jgi:hypothetical protein
LGVGAQLFVDGRVYKFGPHYHFNHKLVPLIPIGGISQHVANYIKYFKLIFDLVPHPIRVKQPHKYVNTPTNILTHLLLFRLVHVMGYLINTIRCAFH